MITLPGTGHKIDFGWERARPELGDDDSASGMCRNLGRAARAGQADGWRRVVANDGRVDVAPPINLRAAQEAYADAAILQHVLEDVRHAGDHEAAGDERGIADRDWQAFRYGAHGSGFVDKNQVR